MYHDISIEEALALKNRKVNFIDLRSEKEYQEDAIPGAINIPIFNNEERAKIGTTYKQIGVEEAKKLGLDIVGPKLSRIYSEIRELSKDKPIVLYCWRGGMRSKYMASMLDSMGLYVRRIIGGYKAYRRTVHDYLYREQLPHRAVVLCGLTGVSKTHILKRLEKMGTPVLDLEELANHRGSVYGKIAMPPSPSQKKFETNIAEKLTQYEQCNYFIAECESRRIGQLLVPPAVMNSLRNGYKILIYAKLSTRVNRIIHDYTNGPNYNIDELQTATSKLTKYLGTKKVEELNVMLAEQKFEEVFTYLLANYYDRLYKYPEGPDKDFDLCVDSEDLDLAAERIHAYLKRLPGYKDL